MMKKLEVFSYRMVMFDVFAIIPLVNFALWDFPKLFIIWAWVIIILNIPVILWMLLTCFFDEKESKKYE
mgnify:CR=1 FL=1